MKEKRSKEAKSLLEIDNSFGALEAETDPKKRKKKLLRFFEALSMAVKNGTSEEPLDNLFSRKLGAKNRQFVAISLLRLFTIKNFSFSTDRNLVIKTYELFDDVFENNIYQVLGISSSQQTYEKERILRDVVLQVEEDLDVAIDSIININEIDSYRSLLMRSLHNKLVKVLIWPYLPLTLLSDIQLNEIFQSIKTYQERKEQKKYSTLAKAEESIQIIDTFREDAKNYGTIYSMTANNGWHQYC